MVTSEQAIDRINRAFGFGGGHRSLHAKGRFYTATFTATPDAATLCRAAHLQGTPVPAIVRLSNGTGHTAVPDRAPDVRGIGVSFRPPDAGATDILGQTAPRFPVHTPEEFVKLTEYLAVAQRKPWLIAGFLATRPGAVRALLENGKAGAVKAPRSFAATTFYAVHAFRWLDTSGAGHWVRYTWVPDPGVAMPNAIDKSDPDYLHHELETRLESGSMRLGLRVQVAGEGDDPHDPTSKWKSTRHVNAGTLEITAPDPERETHGDVVVFDPTRVIDGIELSDDPILRFRPGAYSVSVNRRV